MDDCRATYKRYPFRTNFEQSNAHNAHYFKLMTHIRNHRTRKLEVNDDGANTRPPNFRPLTPTATSFFLSWPFFSSPHQTKNRKRQQLGSK